MLVPVLLKFINHKLVLAGKSFYYRMPELKASLNWAYGMQQLLKFKKDQLTEKDLALMVNQNKQHLYKILPCDKNKSYESSLKNYNKIITLCGEMLQPKPNM